MRNSVSVLIPAYNAELTLEATLSSVVNQTQRPDEIIVLDDGSTDRTAEIALQFGPSIKLQRQQNAGVSRARNVLLRAARHDLVAFLDSDDVWHPKYLEHQLRAIERCPDAVAYYTGFHTVQTMEEWKLDADDAAMDEQCRCIEPKELLRRYYGGGGFIIPSFTIFFKRALVDILGPGLLPPNIDSAEDVFMWYSLALAGPFVELTGKLGAYRLTAGSLSSNRLHASQRRAAALEYLVKLFEKNAPADMKNFPVQALVTTYRTYGRLLMGVGDTAGARSVLKKALGTQRDWRTAALFAITYFPAILQPRWPAVDRRHV